MAICKRCGGFSKRTGFCKWCISVIKLSNKFNITLEDKNKIIKTIEGGLYGKKESI